MCGRFLLLADPERIMRAFGLVESSIEMPDFRYNIAPGQSIAAVYSDAPKTLSLGQWGLSIEVDRKPKFVINARSETIEQKATFRSAGRCVVPATGFYEWRAEGKQKTPFVIRPVKDELIAFAGLWRADPKGRAVVIVTSEPNELVATIHDRMPMMLTRNEAAKWLRKEAFMPGPLRLQATEIDDYVNATANEGVRCLAPPTNLKLPF